MRPIAALACLPLLAACAGPHATERGDSSSAASPSRAEVARALHRFESASDARGRAEALLVAWQHRGALVDDTVLRALVRDLTVVPAGLKAAHQLEEVAAMASAPNGAARALEVLSQLTAHGLDATRWTEARGLLLSAALSPPAEEQGALLSLRRLHQLDPVGGIGDAQKAQARLMQATLEHHAARYKEAIAAYLKVDQSTGLWRESRLGMAWAQLRIAQPDRAIAVLALLPGGLTADPERALVAAMAAGALGKLDAARAVIAEARTRAAAWTDEQVDLVALQSLALAVGTSVKLREPEDGIVRRLVAHPAVRLMAAELRAARELIAASNDAAFVAYLVRLEAAWPNVIEPLVVQERERARRALEALDALEPQLQ